MGLPYYQVIMRDKPIRYYRLGETSGTTATDSSSSAQNGTLNGTVTINQAGAIKGDPNKAMSFDGSTGYISVPTTGISSVATISVEAWLNVTTFADNAGAVSQRAIICNIDGNNAFQLSLENTGKFALAVNDTGTQYAIQSGSTYATSAWHHVIGTYTASGHVVNLYVNGVIDNGATPSYGIGTSGLFNIGRRTDANGYYSGNLDEIAVYTSVLTANQISAHYQAGIASFTVRPQHRGIARIL